MIEQMKSLARSKTRSGVNLDYLKAVLVRFFQFENKNSERKALIPVIAQIMQFTDEDRRAIQKAQRDSTFWAKVTGALVTAAAALAPNAANAVASAVNPNHNASAANGVEETGSGGSDMDGATTIAAKLPPTFTSIVYKAADEPDPSLLSPPRLSSTTQSVMVVDQKNSAASVAPTRHLTSIQYTSTPPNGNNKPQANRSVGKVSVGGSGGTPLKSALKQSPATTASATAVKKPASSPHPAIMSVHAVDL